MIDGSLDEIRIARNGAYILDVPNFIPDRGKGARLYG